MPLNPVLESFQSRLLHLVTPSSSVQAHATAVLGIAFLAFGLAVPLDARGDCLPPAFLFSWGGIEGSTPGLFSYPRGVEVNDDGVIYVADTDNNRIQALRPTGGFFAWGSLGSGNGQFVNPQALAIDASQNVFVVDGSSLQKFTATGGFRFRISLSGAPSGVAVDPTGNVYVALTEGSRIQKYSGTGTFLTEWYLDNPVGIACDEAGFVYSTSFGAISQFEKVIKFTDTGAFVTEWGSLGSGDGQFDHAYGLAARNGKVFVADSHNQRIQVFTTDGFFLTSWGRTGSEPGQFQTPRDIAAGADGSLYVADYINHRMQKFTGLAGECEAPTAVLSSTWSRIKVLMR